MPPPTPPNASAASAEPSEEGAGGDGSAPDARDARGDVAGGDVVGGSGGTASFGGVPTTGGGSGSDADSSISTAVAVITPSDPPSPPDPPCAGAGRRMGVIACLYFVSDIGLSFLFGAFITILLTRGIPLTQLALVNLLGIAYFARFLLGPLVDRFGHYKRWLIATQPLLVASLLTAAALDPVDQLPAVLAAMTAFCLLSALHDTATGGLAVRLLKPHERGLGNGIQAGAASLSILLGGGGSLLVYNAAGWTTTLLVLAGVFLIPFAALATFKEPPTNKATGTLRASVGFLKQRKHRHWTLGVVPLLMLGLYVATGIQAAMLVKADWSLPQIALVQQTAAPLAGLVAGVAAGAAIRRWGRRTFLRAAGIGTGLAIAALYPLAAGGGMFAGDFAAIVAVTAVYTATATWIYTIAMDLTRTQLAATDFALQLSVLGVLRVLTASAGLAVADRAGLPAIITASLILALTGTAVADRWLRGHQGG